MAINKIIAPLSTGPNVFAAPVINQLAALLTDCNHGLKVNNGVVKKGSVFNIGGSLFIADSDTPISGTQSGNYIIVKFTVSGDTASVSYVSSFVGIEWDGSNQGYYDTSGNYYYTDGVVQDYFYLRPSGMYKIFTGTEPIKIKCSNDGVFNIISYVYSGIESGEIGAFEMQVYVNGTAAGSLTAVSAGESSSIKDNLTLHKGDIVSLVFPSQSGTDNPFLIYAYLSIQLVP